MSDVDHRTHRIVCDCHHPLHFIEFNWTRWKEGDEDIDVFFCSHRIGGFWKRVWRACRYIFGSQELVTGDICMSKEKARDLAAFLSEVGAEPPVFERMSEGELLTGIDGLVKPGMSDDY